MERKFHTIYKSIIGLFCVASLFSSCNDALTEDPTDVVQPKNMYQTKYDANAAVLGVYTKLNQIAQQYVILNEVRGDLMDVTQNADQNLKELNEHDPVSLSNPYISPAPFYSVILSCNDVLYNLDKMYQSNKLKPFEYNERYSDVGALRSWLYFQLVNQFGEVPYITQPLADIDAVKDSMAFPKVKIDAMVDSLINFMETKVLFRGRYSEWFIDNTSYASYIGSESYIGATFIPKSIILGDLYLFKGDYTRAATNYRAFIDLDNASPTLEVNLESHRLCYNSLNIYQNDNTSSINNNWRNMFSYSLTLGKVTEAGGGATYPMVNEMEWIVPFDRLYGTNTLFDLFASSRKYYLKPSQVSIENWNAQYMLNGTPGDRRGEGASWMNDGNRPVILKYLLENAGRVTSFNGTTTQTFIYYPTTITGGRWYIYRAGLTNIRLAEAVNRAGYPRIAMALLNGGIPSLFPTNTNAPAPFDFSGVNNNNRTWYRNAGIRGRVDLKNIIVPAGSTQDSINFIENKLIEEAALETAFEGNRWTDLVRIAKRRNDPSFLADKVYKKLQEAGNPNADAARSRLMNENNWYLPFKW